MLGMGKGIKGDMQPTVKALNNLALGHLSLKTRDRYHNLCYLQNQFWNLDLECKNSSFSGETFRQRALGIHMHKRIALT